MDHVVVVGASLAGLQAAQTLRRADEALTITMVGEESHLPYDRPPLSKHYLAGEWSEEKLRLRAAADPDALGVDWKLGVRAVGLDVAANTIALDTGESLGFDGLVIATGASPRRLPGGELDGVHVLRTLDDATALRRDLEAGPAHVVVIGAGFIGAEVAATARQRGLAVSMIEAAATPLSRVLPADAGEQIAVLHRSHGVDVRLGVGASIVGSNGSVTAVELSDGTVLEADVVVVGIGVVPATGWLENSGLTIDNGVVCDATCMAAPGIVAAGDVARWPNQRFGSELTRVEQWDNAVEQGGYAARRLLAWATGGDVEPYTPVPWFWSDQYDRKIQLAGVPTARSELVQGSIEEQTFVQMFLDDGGSMVGALTWNRPRQAIQSRQLITRNAPIDEVRTTLAPASPA